VLSKKIATCGFPWEKTTKGAMASVYTNCKTSLAEFLQASSNCPPLGMA
jgi:hypothetical protein